MEYMKYIPEIYVEEKMQFANEEVIYIKQGMIRELVSTWINQNISFHVSSIFAVDEEDRIELFYSIFFRELNTYFSIAEKLDRDRPVTQTLSDLTGSIFYEGEATEMFGIDFEGNKVTEVFLPESWEYGHPLRKDWVDKRKEEVN